MVTLRLPQLYRAMNGNNQDEALLGTLSQGVKEKEGVSTHDCVVPGNCKSLAGADGVEMCMLPVL